MRQVRIRTLVHPRFVSSYGVGGLVLLGHIGLLEVKIRVWVVFVILSRRFYIRAACGTACTLLWFNVAGTYY